MTVIKRDNTREPFEKQKVKLAVTKAFIDVDGEATAYAKDKAREIANYIESLEHKILVCFYPVLAVGDHHRRKSSRSVHRKRLAHLFAYTVDHSVDHTRVTEYNARAHTVHGVLADNI